MSNVGLTSSIARNEMEGLSEFQVNDDTNEVIPVVESAPGNESQRVPWFRRRPVCTLPVTLAPGDENLGKKIKNALLFKWFERVGSSDNLNEQAAPVSDAPAGASPPKSMKERIKICIHYSWFDSVFNSRVGPSMRRLLIRKQGETEPESEGGEEEEEGIPAVIESSHEFVVRPCVPTSLKYLLAPLIMCLQFIVFYEIYKETKNTCTDYSKWSTATRYGIGLATLFVSAQICAQALQGIRIFLAGYYSKQPWAVFLAVGMLTQFSFEIVVYSSVMGSSLTLTDLIKDFVALAVANETDDVVGAYLNIRSAKKIMFLDPIEEGEQTQLQQNGSQFKSQEFKNYRVLRSGEFGPNSWNHIIYSGHAWVMRVSLLAIVFIAVVSQVLITWDKECLHTSDAQRATYSSYIISDLASSSVYQEYGSSYTTLSAFDIGTTFGARDAAYAFNFTNLQFAFPYSSDFANDPITFSGLTITSNGLFQLTDPVRSPLDFPHTTAVLGAEIAPFFGNYKIGSTSHFYAFGLYPETAADGTTVTWKYVKITDTVLSTTPVSELVFILKMGVFDIKGCAFPAYQSDRWCDPENNTEECAWDGGDCCEISCAVIPDPTSLSSYAYTCGDNGYYCLNPDPEAAIPTPAPVATTYISYELIISSCGDISIHYPSDFSPPDYDFTIGYQWWSASEDQLKSGCRGHECWLNFYIYTGTTMLLKSSFSLESVSCGYFTNKAITAVKAAFDAKNVYVGSMICYADPTTLGDGQCTDYNNTPQCSYDGGDCCSATCVPETYRCQDFNCIDSCQINADAYCETSPSPSRA